MCKVVIFQFLYFCRIVGSMESMKRQFYSFHSILNSGNFSFFELLSMYTKQVFTFGVVLRVVTKFPQW